MLEALGVDTFTQRVYEVMLVQPRWGLVELAEHLGCDERDVGVALDRLAELSLLRNSWDRPGALRLVNPQLALDALLAREQAEVSRRQQQVENARAAVAALVANYTSNRGAAESGTLEVLEGLDAIRGRLEDLAQASTTEVLSFLPRPQSEESMAASRPLDEAALARGVAVRSVYLDSIVNHPATYRYALWLTGSGGECRTAPTLPLWMQVVDRQVAVVPLEPAGPSHAAVLMGCPGMVHALHSMFERYWETATPAGPRRCAPAQELSTLEHALLRLLANGCKDEMAARHLGVSVRTVRRLISTLMSRLGAASRFEAGVRAQANGWLPAAPALPAQRREQSRIASGPDCPASAVTVA